MNTINLNEVFKTHPLPEIENLRATEAEFVADLVIVSNLVLKFLGIAAAVVPQQNLNKLQQGVLLGHAVNIFKLYDSFLLLISEKRLETSFLLARAIVESSLVLSYLTEEINDDICQKFIKSSLAYDKKLFEMVQTKSKEKNLKSFEKRIITSIQNTFSKTKYKLHEIEFKKDKDWHIDLANLAKRVGLEDLYETLYRNTSRAEHCSWFYLDRYNLIENDINHYEPNLKYSAPRPQLLEAVNCLCLKSTLDYIKRIYPDKDFIKYTKELIKWHIEISKKHEQFLTQQ